jgi:hypothetical protein
MITIDAFAFGDRWDTSLPPGFRPDREYGPLLLFDAEANEWMIGRWLPSGARSAWWDEEGGYRIRPKAWALLPPAPGPRSEATRAKPNPDRAPRKAGKRQAA